VSGPDVRPRPDEKARAVATDVGTALPKQHRGGGSHGRFTVAPGISPPYGLGRLVTGAQTSHEHISWRHLGQRASLPVGLLETPA